MIDVQTHWFDNGDGWELAARVTRAPGKLRKELRPLLILPGYGMNTFILGFHPRGTSMEATLAEAGFEVWSVNMRRQGDSRAVRKAAAPPSLKTWSTVDVPAAIDGVLARTQTEAEAVDLIGCSLGGSVVFAHLALEGGSRVGSVISIGGPLKWVDAPMVLRLAFRSPTVASLLRLRGTRRFARAALPVLAKVPGLLSIYMNTDICDLSAADQLVQTVDDPHPRVNTDIAHWMRDGDMVLRGVNVTQALGRVEHPLLLVVANRDGIVPPATALSARSAWGGRDVEALHVGDEREWYAHADLFISHRAPQVVFEPMAQFLHARQG